MNLRLVSLSLLALVACHGAADRVSPESLGPAWHAVEESAREIDAADALAERGDPDGARELRTAADDRLARTKDALLALLDDDPSETGAPGEALAILGRLHELQGDPLRAAEFDRRAWNAGVRTPSLVHHYRAMGLWLHRSILERRDEASLPSVRQAYEDALAAAGGDQDAFEPPEPLRAILVAMTCELGETLILLDEFDDAKAAFESALDLDQDAVAAYEGLGAVAALRLDRRESFRQFRRALQLDPDSVTALRQMMNLMIEDQRPAEARRYQARLQALRADSGPSTD